MVGQMTTTGSPSVSYLPGGFTTMKNMLRSLSTVKKKWNIEVLETDDHQYSISFENQMNVIVPKFAYAEFNNKVLRVVGKKHIDLTEMINEAKSEKIHDLYDNLTRVLTIDLRGSKEIYQTIVLLNFWLATFPGSKYVPMESQVLIQLNSYDKDVRSLIDRIQNIYTDDLGTLQMMTRAIKDGRPLGQFEPFSEYTYLIGARVNSVYEGIHMTLELTINATMFPAQSIYIEAADALEEIGNLKNAKVVGRMMYPVGPMFTPGTFTGIREVLDNMK